MQYGKHNFDLNIVGLLLCKYDISHNYFFSAYGTIIFSAYLKELQKKLIGIHDPLRNSHG